MASNRARLLWENSILLRDAWRHFASHADQGTLNEMPRALDAMTKFASDHAGDGLKAIADAIAIGVRTSQEHRAVQDRLREDLLTDLFNEQLIAAGFRERPSFSSAPVLIEAGHFAECVADWEQSKIEANGRLWNRVKISPPEKPIIRKVPNSRDAIEAAIRELIAKNAKLATAPGKIRCDAVRAEIGQNYVSGNGLSDQNIERHFVRICGIKRISKTKK